MHIRASAGCSATKPRKAASPASTRSSQSSSTVGASLFDPAKHLVPGGVEGGEEDLLLALEVVVERFAGDAGAA